MYIYKKSIKNIYEKQIHIFNLFLFWFLVFIHKNQIISIIKYWHVVILISILHLNIYN